MGRPTVVCPVDFSECSRGALQFAACIAEHFFADLTVVTVDDPLLSCAAAGASGAGTYETHSKQELERFVGDTFRRRPPTIGDVRLDAAVGNPAKEILRIATEHDADLIVMSTHGRSGIRKAFFGSTTEQLLRDTPVPVLVTPAGDPGPIELEDLTRGFRGVLAPVDLTPSSRRQAAVAYGLAHSLGTTLTLVHVIEPLVVTERARVARMMHEERKQRAPRDLNAIADALGNEPKVSTKVVEGDPAAEIVRMAAVAAMGAIVMGLHDKAARGARIGSVTCRVLCRAQIPVLALPPSRRATDKPRPFARRCRRPHPRFSTMSLPEWLFGGSAIA